MTPSAGSTAWVSVAPVQHRLPTRCRGDRDGHLAAVDQRYARVGGDPAGPGAAAPPGKVAQAEATALLDAPAADVILLDARRDLVGARSLCRLIETTGKESPLLVIASEGGLAALSADWGFDDILLVTAGPAEVDVRIRLAMTPRRPATPGNR